MDGWRAGWLTGWLACWLAGPVGGCLIVGWVRKLPGRLLPFPPSYLPAHRLSAEDDRVMPSRSAVAAAGRQAMCSLPPTCNTLLLQSAQSAQSLPTSACTLPVNPAEHASSLPLSPAPPSAWGPPPRLSLHAGMTCITPSCTTADTSQPQSCWTGAQPGPQPSISAGECVSAGRVCRSTQLGHPPLCAQCRLTCHDLLAPHHPPARPPALQPVGPAAGAARVSDRDWPAAQPHAHGKPAAECGERGLVSGHRAARRVYRRWPGAGVGDAAAAEERVGGCSSRGCQAEAVHSGQPVSRGRKQQWRRQQ